MTTLLIIIHVTVCLFLIAIVLLQHGKGADIGATFGGSSQTLFGSEGPVPLLNKITTFSAIIFMGTSVSLAYLSAHRSTGSVMTSVVKEAVVPSKKEVPVMIPAPQEKPAGTVPLQPLAEKAAEPAASAAQKAALPVAEAPAAMSPVPQEKPAAEAKIEDKPTEAVPAQSAAPAAEKTAEPASPTAQQAALPAAEAPAAMSSVPQEKPAAEAKPVPAAPAEKKAE